MQRTPQDNIGEVLRRFYSDEELMTARDVLISSHTGSFDYEMKERSNTTGPKASRGKKKAESVIEDILIVMYELDRKKIVTEFVVRDLARLPKCDPKDVDPYSNLQYIIDLQQRVKNLEDNAGSIKAQLLTQSENTKTNTNTLADHETMFAEHEV